MNLLLHCAHCNKKFTQAAAEYNRNHSLGIKRPYCSFKCYKLKGKKTYRLKHTGKKILARKSRLDKYSPFRNLVAYARARTKKKNLPQMNIDVQYLYQLYKKQQGICPLSPGHVAMLIPKSTADRMPHLPNKISVDRIVPALGYVKGNVELVCVSANYAKLNFDRSVAFNFLNPKTKKASLFKGGQTTTN